MVFDGSHDDAFGFRINEYPQMMNTESKPVISLYEKVLVKNKIYA
jgi:hypothetical protein